MKKLIAVAIAVILTLSAVMCAFGAPAYKGDLDGDGKVLAGEARRILRMSAKLDPQPNRDSEAFRLADVDGDGKLLAKDARIALRISAKLEPMMTNQTADFSTITEGKLIMATNAAFPPYEYIEDNMIVGIDAEIAALIAEKLGLELEIQDVDFDSIVPGVAGGKYDMGIAGMTVTEERKKIVNFTDTYATNVQAIIVSEGSPIKSADDIATDGSMKIGVQLGTIGDFYASAEPEDWGFGEDNVKRYKTGPGALQALISGKVDAVIIDNETAKSYVAANEGLVLLSEPYTEENYAICVDPSNAALLDAVNGAILELISDGSIQAIIDKYS